MEWQPIETAPKNADILLYCPRRGVAMTAILHANLTRNLQLQNICGV